MPRLNKVIQGWAYDPVNKYLGFNLKGMIVTVEPYKISVVNASDEAAAREVVDWLKDILNTTDESRQVL